ncbi:glutamine--fructose-6-phosphate transaminase (isomerizing) [Candidatus Heimdallarchaeota archaeon B3_Heim]|nr:MAG: glutamine--fructose-6-phosphate transaminase (isomerizing) [Candidatus Heimdallarchaeota archaeon B3_Heim]
MCGIIAITTRRKTNVSKMITSGLKRLEYRGYDSVGIATISEGKIQTMKDAGTIDQVTSRLSFDTLEGSTGIGHTRWATHGPPTRINAHPHADCSDSLMVVHNGIIDNYLSLRNDLKKQGHKFKSETDTEVLAHLIEEEFKSEKGPNAVIQAFKKALDKIEGTYAITLIHTADPTKIFLARKDSPLVIGVQDDTKFAASDIPAFLEYTKNAIVLKNGEVATLTPEAVYIEKNGFRVQPKPFIVSWTAESAQKSGYPHFMLKEIHEQPIALQNTLNVNVKALEEATKRILEAEKIIILAAGTSYHAGLSGYYQFQRLLKQKPIYPIIASEYETYNHLVDENTCILAVSQSGETLDVMKGLTAARKAGAKIISIANVIDSSIPRLSQVALYTKAGPEIGVAATKTHTAQVALLARLSLQLEYSLNVWNQQEFSSIITDFTSEVPSITRTVINQNEFKAKQLASIISDQNHSYFLARGKNLPIAMEGALKLKEISYIHAEAFPAGESKHGPIAIVEPKFPVFIISPKDETRKKMFSNSEEMKARGGYIISITHKDQEIVKRSDQSFLIPESSSPLITPISYVIPLQMISYYAAVHRGFDPDKPKNLAKTVTVE